MKRIRKKKTVVIAIILATAMLSGCSFGKENGGESSKNQKKIIETKNEIEGLEDSYNPTGELPELFSKKVAYEVTNISWDGDNGTAEVIVTAPDMETIIPDAIQTVIDKSGNDEDYDKLLEKAKASIEKGIKSKKCPFTKTTVEMEVKRNTSDSSDDNEYTLISNHEFEKAITGNLEEIYFNTLMEGLADEKDESE